MTTPCLLSTALWHLATSANINIDNTIDYNIVEAPDTEPETPENPETNDYFAFHISYLMPISIGIAIGKKGECVSSQIGGF